MEKLNVTASFEGDPDKGAETRGQLDTFACFEMVDHRITTAGPPRLGRHRPELHLSVAFKTGGLI